MKNSILTTFCLVPLCLAFTSCDKDDSPEDKNIKRYNVESGIIKYTTSISGTIGGGTVTGTGTVQLYFENWGARELKDEKSVTTTIISMPEIDLFTTDVSTIHNTDKIDNEMIYIVDYDTQTIFTKEDPLIEFMRLYDYDASEAGKKMLISMGSVQSDNEAFKGYDCEVWTTLGSTQWIYKGVTLKIVSIIGDITSSQEATEIKFDVSVNDSYFELPDYPETDISDL